MAQGCPAKSPEMVSSPVALGPLGQAQHYRFTQSTGSGRGSGLILVRLPPVTLASKCCENWFVEIPGYLHSKNRETCDSLTSLNVAIWAKVPRPISAARVMKNVLGADPIPTVKTRERPRPDAMVSNNCCSLPMAPSVMKNHLTNALCVA